MRMLLSFTSGFYWEDASAGDAKCLTSLAGAVLYSAEACARQIYDKKQRELLLSKTQARRGQDTATQRHHAEACKYPDARQH